MYFQLAGRVLLIFLFVGFVFSGSWSAGRIIVSLIGAIASIMVVVGFKAKFSATLLVVILSIFNVLVNNFWTVSSIPPISSSLPSPTILCRDLLPILGEDDLRRLMFFYVYPDANSRASFTSTTPRRTLPSTTSSRSSPSLVASFSWSTVALANSVSTRRRRCTKRDHHESNVTHHKDTVILPGEDRETWSPLQRIGIKIVLSFSFSETETSRRLTKRPRKKVATAPWDGQETSRW